MSERSDAPRSGGRAAEPQRPVTGRRDTSTSRRDADTQGSGARGARHFAGAAEDGVARRSDTRRSGTRSEAGRDRDAGRERGASRERGEAREARTGPRDTEGVRAKARDTESVRAKARRAGADRDRKAAAPGRRSRTSETPGGRGRVTAGRDSGVDAPVDGAAALQIEVVAAEPLKAAEAASAPRLRVAPPPPIHGGPRATFAAAVVGVVVVGVLGILLINTKTNENSFRIADLQKQNSVLENQRQDLDNQLVEASRIGNLDAAARRLGLVRADIQEVAQLRLPDGKIIDVPKPAKGAQSPTRGDAVGDKGVENVSPIDSNGTGR